MALNERSTSLRILLVDDDRGFVDTFGAMLTFAGYAVTGALTYASALTQLSALAPDLLITDLQLGDAADGWDLVRLARSARPFLPVIVVTAMPYAVPEDDPASRTPVFLKPFDPTDVLQYLESATRSLMSRPGSAVCSDHADGAYRGTPMGQGLPTREGDVVIVHRRSLPAEFHIWLVLEDNQQVQADRIFRPMQVRDRARAIEMASDLVSDTGTIFVLEQDSNHWSTIPP